MRKTTYMTGIGIALSVGLVTAPAAADEPEAGESSCPPGAYCETAEVAPDSEGMQDPDGQPEVTPETDDPQAHDPELQQPDQKEDPNGAASVTKEKDRSITVVIPPGKAGQRRVVVVRTDPKGGEPDVVEYEEFNKERPKPPAGYGLPEEMREEADQKKQQRRARHRRWGLGLRLDGVIGQRFSDEGEETRMGGLGVSLRYRPVPAFALDFSADVLAGTDANGYERREVPLGITAMIYPFTRSLVQPYLMVGGNWAHAKVYSEEALPQLAQGTSDEYSYLGGHAGLGLEFRITNLVGLNIDGLAFLRERIDDGAEQYPEFYDTRSGEASNTTVGGMLRGGINFWW